MKNIVLLGGSNSVMVNGLQKVLKEYANVINLALGCTTSLQNLYELKREKNQEAAQNADLIITESVINELDIHNIRENLSLGIIFKNLYATLYTFNRPVCILILPYRFKNYQIVINMHRFLANYYGLILLICKSTIKIMK
ncbi:glycosyltransferase [Campylobacter devanensis]|uniref:glycosyltransferase n=1 Tax=Campylobacter devanensis TaxID=3161138 RepID=UPI0015D6CF15|nr:MULTISPECIES: glycosyltransferase [unclassified Campylobacter]